MSKKVINFILSALFFIFAAVQYNDPDPMIWVTLYIAVGAIALMAAFKVYFSPLIIIVMLACAILGIMSAPGVWEFITNQDGNTLAEGMSYEFAYIEETREFGGAFIALLALTYLAVQAVRFKRLQNPQKPVA